MIFMDINCPVAENFQQNLFTKMTVLFQLQEDISK